MALCCAGKGVTAAWKAALAAAQAEVAAAARRGAVSFSDRYVPLAVVAQGSCSKVLKARAVQSKGGRGGEAGFQAERDSGQLYAVRVSKNLGSEAQMTALVTEVAIHRLLSDLPSVAPLQELFIGPKEIYLVMQLCEGGDLGDYLAAKAAGGLSERTAAEVLAPLLELASAAHLRGVVLRNLAPDCIMLSSARPDARIKVVSFRLSAFCEPGSTITGTCGAPAHMAPQVLLRQPYDSRADSWTLGVLACLLLTGRNPFQGASITDTMARVTAGIGGVGPKEWSHLSAGARKLLAAMLHREPAARPNPAKLLADPWFVEAPVSPLGPEVLAGVRAYVASLRVQRLARLALAHVLVGQRGLAAGLAAAKAGADTQTRLLELQALFNAADVNKDSRISSAELYAVLSRASPSTTPNLPTATGPSPSSSPTPSLSAFGLDRLALDRLFAAADLDGSGFLDRTEFVAALLDANAVVRGDQARRHLYAAMDLDGDGCLSEDEVALALGGLQGGAAARRAAAEVMCAYDTDNDGKLTLAEFTALYDAQPKPGSS